LTSTDLREFERLTYPQAGHGIRLTGGEYARVVKEILA
jgi:hypothetical protein